MTPSIQNRRSGKFVQVIVTMAGKGQRFVDAGFSEPKAFVQIDSKYVFQLLVDTFPPHWIVFFVVNDELPESYRKILNELYPQSRTLTCAYSPRGPLDSVRAAIPFLKAEEPVIISYCDYAVIWDPHRFEQTTLTTAVDAAIVGYRGFHPTYLGPNTYCHYEVENNRGLSLVSRLQEKKQFTENLEAEWTSCGLYYFFSAQFLADSLRAQVEQHLSYRGEEFYTSLALQASFNLNPALRILNYPIDYFLQLGTPFDVGKYFYWKERIFGEAKPSAFDEREKKYWEAIFTSNWFLRSGLH